MHKVWCLVHGKHKRYDKSVKTTVKSRLILIIWAFSLLAPLIPQRTVAANFTYDTNVTYRVSADGTATVTENYTVTNNTPRNYLTEIKLTTPTTGISGLKVNYEDGTKIPATTTKKTSDRGDLHYDYQEINIVFPRQNYGSGKAWKFNLTYQAEGLVETKGNSHTVYVPTIEQGSADDDYNVTVDVPQEYGTPHFAGAKSATSGLNDGRQFYTFAKADLTAHSLALSFGDSAVYRANFNFPLHNTSPIPRLIAIALPPDLNSQKAYLTSLDPKPNSTRLDEDGNVLAEYWVAASQTLLVKTNVETEVKYLEYDLAASKFKKDIPVNLARYTAATRYWQTGGAVGEAAHKLVDDKAPVINNVKAIYEFVIEKLSYNKNKIKFNIRQGASAALANPSNAVCLEYADLMIAMLRSQGIPARMPIGYAYSGSLKESSGVADSLHAWVEAYVPGIGWMSLDPTWGEKFDHFGTSDLDHMAFAVWGEHDETPGAIMAGGSDIGYQYEDTKLDFETKVVPAATGESLKATRFALLPFVSLDRVTVTAKPQVATDNNQIKLGDATLSLGSLAPAQRTSLTRLNWGGNWNRPANVKLERAGGGQVMVLATATTRQDYRVMGLIVLILIVAGGWLMVRLRKNKELRMYE